MNGTVQSVRGETSSANFVHGEGQRCGVCVLSRVFLSAIGNFVKRERSRERACERSEYHPPTTANEVRRGRKKALGSSFPSIFSSEKLLPSCLTPCFAGQTCAKQSRTSSTAELRLWLERRPANSHPLLHMRTTCLPPIRELGQSIYTHTHMDSTTLESF